MRLLQEVGLEIECNQKPTVHDLFVSNPPSGMKTPHAGLAARIFWPR